MTWSHSIHDVRDLSGRSEGSRRRKPHQKGQKLRLCLVISARGFLLAGFRMNWERCWIALSSTQPRCMSMGCVREGARWCWPAEGRQCQRRQPCFGPICSARRDVSYCYSARCLRASDAGSRTVFNAPWVRKDFQSATSFQKGRSALFAILLVQNIETILS